MERYLCIHGHFYQPPRENPWLEDVELQDSAYPFHDWNDRITAECYEPNTASRILDADGRITDIVNNYARISFNFGPTLLSWMERHRPETYQGILEADRQSRELFSGHGSAIAQAYGHLIMPLANRRDKETQIIWGIRDFVHRFGRRPEGMWLPETAVDLETLDLLSAHDIRFTILAPNQAKRLRKIGDHKWLPASSKLDPKRPYLCRLPSGRTIALFFYDGGVAQDVAFGGLLRRGEEFAGRLLGTFAEHSDPQLVHIATDGETYGHHHRFGDMALAYALDLIESKKLAKLTNYGEYLETHPPAWEVEILENSSWSCAHGIERWRADCGCRISGNGWHQGWRGPLREALDWLREQLAPIYEKESRPLLGDPWEARNEYIGLILDRRPETMQRFLRRRAGRELNEGESLKAMNLLELQRHAMLMYTSCGWFFDEISGIESTQVLAYASRAVQLADGINGLPLEEEFLRRLAAAPSNLRKWRDGARIYKQTIKPMRLDLIRVAAHHAIACEFEGDHLPHQVYCYNAHNQEYEEMPAGTMKLAFGSTRIRSDITGHSGLFSFAVLHLGGYNINAGVRAFKNDGAFAAMCRDVRKPFDLGDIPETIRQMDRHFGHHNYSLWHLFKDEQRKVVNQILEQTLEEIETFFAQIHEKHASLLRFLGQINMPVPRSLAAPVEAVVNSELRKTLESDTPDLGRFQVLAEEVNRLPITLDETTLRFVAGGHLGRQMERLAEDFPDLELIAGINETLEILENLPMQLDLWKAQNIYCAIWRSRKQEFEKAREQTEGEARELFDAFRRLGEHLQVGEL